MKMKVGDFLDRWTILLMKARLDKSAAQELAEYSAEITFLVEHETWKKHAAFMAKSLAQLAEANGKIWVCEAAIRQEYGEDPGACKNLSLEEVGRRALEIRQYNKLRVEAKKAIDILFGNVPDQKVDHASS